jgi:hypothetical protein
MFAVAVVAIALGIGMITMRMSRTAQIYREKAAALARAEERLIKLIPEVERNGGNPERLDELRRRLVYATAMKKIYEDASRYPWLPVDPDPPRPR